MNVQLEHILQTLFKTSSLHEVPVDSLQELMKEHPYFSTGHFLLTQKLKHEDAGAFESQAQKTAVYFHDPLWLQWQLKQLNGEVQAVEVAEPAAEISSAHRNEPEIFINHTEQIAEQPEVEPEIEQQEEEQTPESVLEREAHEEIRQPEEPEITPEPEAVEEPTPLHLAQPIESNETHIQPEPAVTQPELSAQPQPELEHPVAHTFGPPSEQTITPEPAKEEAPLAFDPYYTIDYFASQGIKVPAEVQPGDKLGRQLKSFTEWLKTMKRLPQAQAEQQVDEGEQQHIRRFADGSLEKKEVVTETMAEVLVKQDKKEEAIAIYEKLSLLDPSKRAYFAAKIENLKVN
jgi:hypothetical protein